MRCSLFVKVVLIVIASLSGIACQTQSSTHYDDLGVNSSAFTWSVGDAAPLPIEPEDNPMTEAKFQLGRHLFYDTRLSGNGTQACSSCHEQEQAFADGLVTPEGSTGDVLARNSQGLANVAYNATLTWANPSIVTLERQILIPLFGEEPIEQGINDENRAEVLQRISDDTVYQSLFLGAFPTQGGIVSYDNIIKAIASFVRGMTSFDSSFDRYQRGDTTALSASAQRGRELFFSEKMECFHCHGGYNFSDSTLDRTMAFVEMPFHNTGLFNIDGTGAYPDDNQGIFSITGVPSDMGKFRAVSLRNVGVTAPYMHDGSIATLEEVVDFYAAGGRNIESGAHAGDGRFNPFKDGFVTGFDVSAQEKQDVVAFLESLTDESFLTSERFSNPWDSQ